MRRPADVAGFIARPCRPLRAMGRPTRYDRADSMNPNNAAYAASLANMARQLVATSRYHSRLLEHSAKIETMRDFYPTHTPGRHEDCAAPPDLGTRNAVCTKGHIVKGIVLGDDAPDGQCPRCDARVIMGCTRCGYEFDACVGDSEIGPTCPRCATPFPWSAEARRARLTTTLKILGAAAAGTTILVELFRMAELFW